MNVEVAKQNGEKVVLMENIQFDEFGRCLPGKLQADVHQQSRQYFQIEPLESDLAQSYQRLTEAFDVASAISLDEFKQRVEAILTNIANDEATKQMLSGVYVPFILPKASYQDIGTALEDDYIPVVEKAYIEQFPEYSFTNHSPKSLQNQLQVTPGGRHQQVLDAMADEIVVGIYFPCLLEYSVPAAVERMATLPENFLLAGGFDTAAAFVSAPELLFKKEGYPPLLWMSGLTSVEENVGYHFEAYGYDLTFNRRVHLGQVAEYWASALVVLG